MTVILIDDRKKLDNAHLLSILLEKENQQ